MFLRKEITEADKGKPNGIAGLDENGKVITSQLPEIQDTKKVLVSNNDTTEGYIEDKIAGGDNIDLVTLNDGNNEKIQLSVNTVGLDADKVDGKDVDNNTISDDVLWTAKKIDDTFIHIDGDETITGKKTFNNDVSISGTANIDGDVNIKGNLNYVDTENLQVEDKVIVLDKGGNDADLSGLEIEEDGNIVASLKYKKTDSRWNDGTDNLARVGEITNLEDNKADKINSGTEDNFVSIDDNGNIKDSGKKADDFAEATHTHTKSDITDFNENDYLHIAGDETASGSKTFTGGMKLKNDVEWYAPFNIKLMQDDTNTECSFDFQNADGNKVWHIRDPVHQSILAVRNNGKVGVGEYNPFTKLHIKDGNCGVRIQATNENDYAYIQMLTPSYGDGTTTEGFEIGLNDKTGTVYMSRIVNSSEQTDGIRIYKDGTISLNYKQVDIKKKYTFSGTSYQLINTTLDVSGYRLAIGSIFLRTLDSDKSDHFNIAIGKDAEGKYNWDSFGQVDNLNGGYTLVSHFGDNQDVKLGYYGMWQNIMFPINEDGSFKIGTGGVSGSNFEFAIKIVGLL